MKTGIWYNYFILIKNEKNNIVNFEIKKDSKVVDAALEIINYLKIVGNENTYVLKVYGVNLGINQFKTAKEVETEYYAVMALNL